MQRRPIHRSFSAFALVLGLAGCSLATPVPPELPATQPLPTAEPSPMATVEAALPEAMEVIQTTDRPYAAEVMLDVYAPASGSGWPVVVVFHGGNADKRAMSSLASAVAGQGAVVFVPTYSSSISPVTIAAGGVELGLVEAACAVRYARARASDYGGDARRVVAAGHSGGAPFAVILALAGDEFAGDCVVSEGIGSVDGVVGLDGAYDLVRYTEDWILKKASPEEWLVISPHAWIERQPVRQGVRFLLFAGLETGLVQEGQAMRDALLAAGYTVEFTQMPGIDHLGMGGARPQTVLAIVGMARGN